MLFFPMKKTIVASSTIVGDWYYNKDSSHAKNEDLCRQMHQIYLEFDMI
jgi:hypothetical protein